MKNNYYAVIMAGGIGSRFWPMSTQMHPKQFHDMLGTGQSLIQRTYERINRLVPSNNILIATNERYKDLVLNQLASCAEENVLLEPAMRNTAPCILYAALKIHHQNPDAVMLVAPSDHWIEDEDEFIRNIETSFTATSQQDILMTLGIQPKSPNTGYGYIQFENEISQIKKVKKFTEKPDLTTAKQFLKSGDYLWNAGIFVWSTKSIIAAFNNLAPKMTNLFRQGDMHWNSETETNFIKNNYAKSENISIDFGIMEKASNVNVLPVDFGWNDLGTWGSLFDKLEKDKHGNAVVNAETIFKDASGNMVKTQSEKRVVIEGLKDYIVVEKDDVLLICPKSSEQNIKEITSEVKEKFGDDFV